MTFAPDAGFKIAEGTSGRRVLTFGTFDLFHIGHLRILQRARALGGWMAVGVSSDELNYAKKRILPHFSYDERAAIVGALRDVDVVFKEESLDLKRDYLIHHRADMLVMGHDWEGRFDEFSDIVEVCYLPRTPSISTTSLVARIRSAGEAVSA
ncbi:adenylyltransferase/cytidyltransferase family protein [Sphingomonas sp. ID0503]|uniref:adenylyltransferase/cytidyltransferase family protein n=1 Tax=Sphingomonas sp. ID0503 TaxID=3399691 RepID=UPI003AFA54E0